MSQRLRDGLTITALVLSLLALSGGAIAAAPVVKRTLFAKNAGKVNGIKASRTPKPGHLLSLNKQGKFPASVGVAGPRGAKGDKGDKGATGPSDVYTKNFGSLHAQNGQPIGSDPFSVTGTMAVPAGDYLVVLRANMYNSGSGSALRPNCGLYDAGSDFFHANQIDSGGPELGANSVGAWGIFHTLTLAGVAHIAAGKAIGVNCMQYGTDMNLEINNISVMAVRVGASHPVS